jgi:hypothetical protein
MTKLIAPTSLKQVLQFCPDRDLESHLRAIKKAFPQTKIDFVELTPSPINLAHTREKAIQKTPKPEQTTLF